MGNLRHGEAFGIWRLFDEWDVTMETSGLNRLVNDEIHYHLMFSTRGFSRIHGIFMVII